MSDVAPSDAPLKFDPFSDEYFNGPYDLYHRRRDHGQINLTADRYSAQPLVTVVVPGMSLPHVGWLVTGTKPFGWARRYHSHVLAGSCPKIVE
jgi:hypothetical protein